MASSSPSSTSSVATLQQDLKGLSLVADDELISSASSILNRLVANDPGNQHPGYRVDLRMIASMSSGALDDDDRSMLETIIQNNS